MADKDDLPPPPPPPSQIPRRRPAPAPAPDYSRMIIEGSTSGLAMDSDPFKGKKRK